MRAPIRVLQVIPDSGPLCAGMFSAVRELTSELQAQGHDAQYWTRREYGAGVKSASALVREIDAFKPQVVHIHGLWTLEGLASAFVAQRKHVPYLISPRGMLMPRALEIKRWKKRPYWALFERRVVAGASAVHVTSDAEADSVRAQLPSVRTFVLPNGIRQTVVENAQRPASLAAVQYVMFLGRLHAIKNIESAIRGAAAFPAGWALAIVGDGDASYTQSLRELAATVAPGRVEFLGRLEGAAKAGALAHATALVLPSFSENFGNVVLEALQLGTPVIASSHTPWAVLESAGAGVLVECDASSLSAAFSDVVENRHAWEARRPKARELADQFSWDRIAEDMATQYRSVIEASG